MSGCRVQFLFRTLILSGEQMHGQTHTAVIIINTDYRYREKSADANAQNQQNEAELVHSLSSSIDVQIPGTWMHPVLA